MEGSLFRDALCRIEGECWIWRGPLANHGYAVTRIDGVKRYVHRLVMGLTDEDETQVHHTCETRGCVNPAHLQLVTPAEHSAAHLKDRCRKGHLYGTDNYYVTATGKRICRICTLANNRAWKRRQHDLA